METPKNKMQKQKKGYLGKENKNYICIERRTFVYRYKKGNFEDISGNTTPTVKPTQKETSESIRNTDIGKSEG